MRYRVAYYFKDGPSHTVYAGESLNQSHFDWMKEWQSSEELVSKWVNQFNIRYPDRHYFVERDLTPGSYTITPGDSDKGYTQSIAIFKKC